ncbi:MAG: MerR family transcriptional regulator [Betaproteobacteria bacterium]|nr:MerR family transcriptional regulator [Betaproteobacteria bacterium]MBI3055525.1 MerR family transcriptional regulator [Betaproteobacteria bacterium]
MIRSYRIGQAAARAGITIHQARCYVAAGLVVPCATTEGGYHLFNDTCVARLRLIGAATRAGLQLAEMRGFCHALDAHDTEKVDATRDLLEARMSERRTALRRVRRLFTEACRTGHKTANVTI